MMTCIQSNNKRCVACCNPPGLPVSAWTKPANNNVARGRIEEVKKLWSPITKEQALKINPFAVNSAKIPMEYFKCKMLDINSGCMDYENRPQICRDYKGGGHYSKTCTQDIKTFFRATYNN